MMMHDWPLTLRVNATAASELAPQIYFARTAVYGGPLLRYEDLEPSAKQAYIEIASRVLEALKPEGSEHHPNAALYNFATVLARGNMRSIAR